MSDASAPPLAEIAELGGLRDAVGGERTVYTDGSCHQHRAIGKPVAGYGVVVIGEDGAQLGRIYGPVPNHLPQTAAAA